MDRRTPACPCWCRLDGGLHTWTDEDRHRQTGGQAVVPVRPASDEALPRPCWLVGVALPGLAVALRCPLGLSFSRTRALGQGTRGDPASSAPPPGPAGTAPPGSKEGGGRCGKVINRRRGKGRKYLEDSGDTLSAPTN